MSRLPKIVIITQGVIIILILTVTIPVIMQETWSNNELEYYDTYGFGLERTCDMPLWQKPGNCRYVDNAEKTLDLLRANNLTAWYP